MSSNFRLRPQQLQGGRRERGKKETSPEKEGIHHRISPHPLSHPPDSLRSTHGIVQALSVPNLLTDRSLHDAPEKLLLFAQQKPQPRELPFLSPLSRPQPPLYRGGKQSPVDHENVATDGQGTPSSHGWGCQRRVTDHFAAPTQPFLAQQSSRAKNCQTALRFFFRSKSQWKCEAETLSNFTVSHWRKRVPFPHFFL